MEWQKVQGGFAKRFVLEDGAPVIAVLKGNGGEEPITFFADGDDLERIETESEKLGGLSTLIDNLKPEDIIEICCFMDRTAGTV